MVKSVELGIKSAEVSEKIARSNFYPSVYLTANYNYAKPNKRILPMRDNWADTWNAGLVVQFNLWNWGKTKMDYEAARNDLKKTRVDYENMLSRIELEVKRIFLEIDESLTKYKLGGKMVEQAEENFRISRDKFRNGMLLNWEFLDAEVDLLKSKLEVTKSVVDFNIKLAELKRAAGTYE